MRFSVSVSGLLVALVASSSAGAARLHTRLDEGLIPPACRSYEKLPDTTSPRVELEAKVSIASCMAAIRLAGAQRTLVEPGPARQALDDAARPAIELLDDVIGAGDPVASIIANSTKANIYVGMIVRLRNTVPPISATTVGPALAAHDQHHAEIEPMVTPWVDRVATAYAAIDEIAEAHAPMLGNDPVVQAAVREGDVRARGDQDAGEATGRLPVR